MKNKNTKNIVVSMTFVSLGLHSEVAQAFLGEQPISINCVQQLSDLDKGKLFWKKTTQVEYIKNFSLLESEDIMDQLTKAVQEKKPDMVLKILLLNRIHSKVYGASELLHVAIQNNDFLTLAALISARYRNENGMEFAIFDIHYVHNGLTPIMLAIKNGQKEIVSFLKREGANIFQVDPTKGTALHLAIKTDNPELVREIVDEIKSTQLLYCLPQEQRKAFFNQIDQDDKTIFHVACEEFLEGKLSPTLLASILSCYKDYDVHYNRNEKTKELLGTILLILKKIENDDKQYFPWRRFFNMSANFKKDIVQQLKKMYDEKDKEWKDTWDRPHDFPEVPCFYDPGLARYPDIPSSISEVNW